MTATADLLSKTAEDTLCKRFPGLVLGLRDTRRQTFTSSRIRFARLARNRRATHYYQTASADADGKGSCL